MDAQAISPTSTRRKPATALPGQVVLVFQGGGALGAYQGGVYHALHEAGVEPNWVIGTSIGAINGAIIAGNAFDARLDRIREFWSRMERKPFWGPAPLSLMAGNVAANMMTVFNGHCRVFSSQPRAGLGPQRIGRRRASGVLHGRCIA